MDSYFFQQILVFVQKTPKQLYGFWKFLSRHWFFLNTSFWIYHPVGFSVTQNLEFWVDTVSLLSPHWKRKYCLGNYHHSNIHLGRKNRIPTFIPHDHILKCSWFSIWWFLGFLEYTSECLFQDFPIVGVLIFHWNVLILKTVLIFSRSTLSSMVFFFH